MLWNKACWFSVWICFCTRSFLCWRHGWHQVQSDRRSAHSSNGPRPHTYYQVREMRGEFGFGFCCGLFFYMTVKIGKTISAPDSQFSNSSGLGVKNNLRENVSNYQKWGDENSGLKVFSLLRLQNTNPFLVRRQQRTKKCSQRQSRLKNQISVIVKTLTFVMLKNNSHSKGFIKMPNQECELEKLESRKQRKWKCVWTWLETQRFLWSRL